MVSKKGVAMVEAAALLLSIGGLCVKMIPLAAPVHQFLSELYLGGNSAGVCPVNPAQTRLTGGVVLGGWPCAEPRPCIPLPPN